VGLGFAAGATAVRALLDFAAPDMAPYPMVCVAVLLATLASGVGGGVVALVLGLPAADFFFVQPRLTFQPWNLTHGLSLAASAVAPLIVVWLAATCKHALRSAVRRTRLSETRLIEELGQRLAAIGLAAHALKTDSANTNAIATIELAVDEARQELKLIGQGRPVEAVCS
jgi:K+-sensing histidine kinase KdpD